MKLKILQSRIMVILNFRKIHQQLRTKKYKSCDRRCVELARFSTGLYFHVHQLGTLRVQEHISFPYAQPDPTSPGANVTSCTDDTVHGFPLTGNNKYQAGDLGNIQCDANNINNNNNCKICKCTANMTERPIRFQHSENEILSTNV